MFKLHQSISDLQGKVMWLWHPCAINAIHFYSKKDLFQLDFWRLWRGWWWNNRNRRGHQAGWFHIQDQSILTFLNIENFTTESATLSKCPHKLVQVIGLFTMGGQEVEQEVVLACVKDIIGQGIEIFPRILLAREVKYFQGHYWSENWLDYQK